MTTLTVYDAGIAVPSDFRAFDTVVSRSSGMWVFRDTETGLFLRMFGTDLALSGDGPLVFNAPGTNIGGGWSTAKVTQFEVTRSASFANIDDALMVLRWSGFSIDLAQGLNGSNLRDVWRGSLDPVTFTYYSASDQLFSVSLSTDGQRLITAAKVDTTAGPTGGVDLYAYGELANGGRTTMIGTQSDDRLQSFDFAPVVLEGRDGDDRLIGGDDDDRLLPGTGRDYVDGGLGYDTVIIEDADIEGEVLLGGTGRLIPRIGGSGGFDYRADEEDTLDVRVTNLDLTLAARVEGFEALRWGGFVTLDAAMFRTLDVLWMDADGAALVAAEAGTYTIAGKMLLGAEGGIARLIFIGSGGNDRILGSGIFDLVDDYARADDNIQAGGGNDSVWGDSGNDSLFGGNGNDRLFAESGNDSVSGGAGNDSMRGGAGADTLSGNEGEDSLDGGLGNDSMAGGIGNDFYVLNAAGDAVSEGLGAGNDTVSSSVDHTLGLNFETLVLTGVAVNGGGNDIGNLITGNATANYLQGFGGADTLQGSAGADTLVGDSGHDSLGGGGENDSLRGGDGNDSLSGGLGADTLAGGGDNDSYLVGEAGDRVVEAALGGTADRVTATISYTLTDEVEQLVLSGTAANGGGNTLDNIITGNGVANQLRGLDGNDSLSGGFGADSLYGGNGVDTMAGGAGADTFFFVDFNGRGPRDTGTSEATADRIEDFNAGGGAEGDKIDISAIDANGSTIGTNDPFVFIGETGFTTFGQARFVTISDVAGYGRLELNTNTDTAADYVILVRVIAGTFDATDLVL